MTGGRFCFVRRFVLMNDNEDINEGIDPDVTKHIKALDRFYNDIPQHAFQQVLGAMHGITRKANVYTSGAFVAIALGIAAASIVRIEKDDGTDETFNEAVLIFFDRLIDMQRDMVDETNNDGGGYEQ
jgi:hypothetical protein